MDIIKNPMNLNYLKKFLCICNRKSNQNQDKQKLITSSEITPFFSLKGKLKTTAKITKVTGKTECNMCFNYNGEIPKSEGIKFYNGFFTDTLPDYLKIAKPIAFLHMNADLYSATKEPLSTIVNSYIRLVI